MSISIGNERLYNDLAWLWPIVSPPEDYIAEALQFVDIYRRYSRLDFNGPGFVKGSPSLLHLGCGGGHLDHTLKKYFQITGVDLSQPMLTLAKQLNPELLYLQGDMRSIQLYQTFDAVIIADSIDYMLDENDLRAAFHTAWIHLKPGGVFITYAEEIQDEFENNRTSSSSHSKDNMAVTLVENLYDPDPVDNVYEMTFIYLIRSSGLLTIEIDRHKAGLFAKKTWFSLLRAVGFTVLEHNVNEETFPFFVGVRSEESIDIS
jgi:SAM-dependent methyltransferase